ncbi:HAAS signaling domain-containing protein, partial [Streptomyces longispororuber]|uniref:HAAS signaling domain-containing protein n=1 Tax=Streptomyces longispororuber TaxID=68230 RepID=UPI004032A79D
MGIESDQLVFDYLSRVGDLAQQRQLPSAARMRLVADLRGEIDRRRAKGADSPAAVRRILDRIGTPEELVDAAADPSGEPVVPAPPAAAPPEPKRPRLAVPRPRLAGPRLAVPRPRKASGT